jgi:hypothetical protein
MKREEVEGLKALSLAVRSQMNNMFNVVRKDAGTLSDISIRLNNAVDTGDREKLIECAERLHDIADMFSDRHEMYLEKFGEHLAHDGQNRISTPVI